MKHFEILVEDSSGKALLGHLMPKILTDGETYNIHSYKGIGKIPPGMITTADASKRILLSQLPKILQGYGRTFENDPEDYKRSVVVICDLDDKDRNTFENELNKLLNSCTPAPPTLFCISIEEAEAWLLGDPDAVKAAYPHAKLAELASYQPDSICGTWEKLADIVYNGGSRSLKKKGYQDIGAAKHEWANFIAPHIVIEKNTSPSFQEMVHKIRSA